MPVLQSDEKWCTYNTEINPNTVFFGRRNAQRRTNLQEYEWRQVRPVAEARYAERIGA